MNKTVFNRAYSLVLIVALAFGQVGTGFFHNKHDAHEAVIDLDHTVLVEHGEHCKICSVDWVHQFVISTLELPLVETDHNVAQTFFSYPLIDFSQSLTRDRAPPVIA